MNSSGSLLAKWKPNSENSGADAAVEAAGHRRPAVEHVLADEDQPERGDAEVDARAAGPRSG